MLSSEYDQFVPESGRWEIKMFFSSLIYEESQLTNRMHCNSVSLAGWDFEQNEYSSENLFIALT